MAADPLATKLIHIAAELLRCAPSGEELLSSTTPRYVQRRVIKALDDLHNGNCERAIALRKIADELHARSAVETSPAPDEETPCAKREDGLHCECWYGGETCCGCGDGDRTLGGEWPTCAEVRAQHALNTTPAPRGKPCTCDTSSGGSIPCYVEGGGQLGELWYCQKLCASK